MSPRPRRIDPEEILDAAARVIAERGISALRLQDVAEAAGISVGLIQYRFGTRDGLVEEAVRHTLGRSIARWTEDGTSGADAWCRIAAMIDAAFGDDRSREERWRRWAVIAATLARDPDLAERIGDPHARWRAPLVEVIAEGTAAGELHPAAPVEDVATAISAMIDGLGIQAATHGADLDLAAAREIALAAAAALLGVGRRDA